MKIERHGRAKILSQSEIQLLFSEVYRIAGEANSTSSRETSHQPILNKPVNKGVSFLTSFFGRLVRRSLDVLAGVPSIVFGLFGNAFFCNTLGLGFSILSGGLTLACMVLPILIRSTEEGFRAVPSHYRLSAAALGFSRTTTLWHLLLPAAVPGLVVGLVLGWPERSPKQPR
jgi:hypothetical protein